MKSLGSKISFCLSYKAAQAPFGARVDFLLLWIARVPPKRLNSLYKELCQSFENPWVSVSLFMNSPYSWFCSNSFARDICWMIDMISVFAESLLWQVSVKEPERESSVMCWVACKCRNKFERIIQDNDFKIKLGHVVSHRALWVLCGSVLWRVLSPCLPIMNFISMWELSGLPDTL